MWPIVNVVAPLNSDRILLAELSLSKEMFIYLKAGSCNKSVAMPGLTSTLCTPKSLIHRVSMSASWCRVMTLDGLTRENDIGSSIGWIALLLYGMWMVFTQARVVATSYNLVFWRLD